jgi:hypothetical protein
MDIKYIHTDQLQEHRNNIKGSSYFLKTFVSWALYAPKPRVSSLIATVEAKARVLKEQYDISPEELVDTICDSLFVPLLRFKEDGSLSLKTFLLFNVSTISDRIMSSREMKLRTNTKSPVRFLANKDDNPREAPRKTDLPPEPDKSLPTQAEQKPKRSWHSSPGQVVVIRRKKKPDPDDRTMADLYDYDSE